MSSWWTRFKAKVFTADVQPDGAVGQLQIDADKVVYTAVAIGGRLTFTLPRSTPLNHGATFIVSAPGVDPFNGRAVTPSTASGPLTVREFPSDLIVPQPIVLKSSRLFPAESGFLRRDGAYIRREDGSVWDKRGATMFLLFARYLVGQDITPQIQWMKRVGVNTARILIAGTPGDPNDPRWADFAANYPTAYRDRPDFWLVFDRFLDLMAKEGLRVEITVMSGEDKSPEEWHRLTQQVYDAVAGRWNVMVEWCNEPHSRAERGPALQIVMNIGIDRRGVLSAYGWDLEGVSEAEGNFKPCPVLDWVTARTGRDTEHLWQNGKELMERRQVVGVPIDDDEPIGIAEPGTPGQRSWDEKLIACHFAVARLFGMGATIHTQLGLEGRAPDDSTPYQRDITAAIGRVWQFLPGDLQAGAYLAPHITGSWPVMWKGNPDGDSAVNHAYGKDMGGAAYIVNTASKDGWTAVPLPGWRVEAVGPYPWIAKLVRE